jgi:hypothetical protein
MGWELDQTGVIPDSYLDNQTDSCLVAQLTWAPAMTLPQGQRHHPLLYDGCPQTSSLIL